MHLVPTQDEDVRVLRETGAGPDCGDCRGVQAWRGRRDDFDRERAAIDAELDAIPLPAPSGAETPAPKEPADNETFYEEP